VDPGRVFIVNTQRPDDGDDKVKAEMAVK
jgi:hypothetical protein